MCRTAGPCALVLLAATLWTGSVAAQAADTRLYRQRVDSLARAWREAQERVAAFDDSVNRARVPYTTFVVGPLLLATDTISAELARSAARAVVERLSPWYGRVLERRRTDTLVVRKQIEGERHLTAIARPAGGGELVAMSVVPEVQPVAAAIQWHVMQAMRDDLDPTFRTWLGGSLPVDTVPSTAWADARIQLLSSPTTVARRCYAGDLGACKLALLLEPSDDPLMQWYDAADRRRFVREGRGEYLRRFDRNPALGETCLAGSDSACIEAIRGAVGRMPDAVPSSSRLQLAQLAATIGGTGAMERLLSTPGQPSARISAAAGIPTDSLLKIWLDRARATQPGSQDMSFGIAASSLAWVLIFGALALRSGRWR
jgi:hypothetical protein